MTPLLLAVAVFIFVILALACIIREYDNKELPTWFTFPAIFLISIAGGFTASIIIGLAITL